MAVHDLDMSRFLMGTEPESILAHGSCHIDGRIGSLTRRRLHTIEALCCLLHLQLFLRQLVLLLRTLGVELPSGSPACDGADSEHDAGHPTPALLGKGSDV